ncbi:hypothetical protein Bhyg_05362 [Pseudolycoriella hygida]|uniref:Uncharacterized protein n=1 Tax=Pseudolycoriella hygida TaxID=35572 RepID=A0A9Q0NH34_9DIPT|nr:hypothetical protein Bhyg_05362 [Pseudolycoriella hygida]
MTFRTISRFAFKIRNDGSASQSMEALGSSCFAVHSHSLSRTKNSTTAILFDLLVKFKKEEIIFGYGFCMKTVAEKYPFMNLQIYEWVIINQDWKFKSHLPQYILSSIIPDKDYQRKRNCFVDLLSNAAAAVTRDYNMCMTN